MRSALILMCLCGSSYAASTMIVDSRLGWKPQFTDLVVTVDGTPYAHSVVVPAASGGKSWFNTDSKTGHIGTWRALAASVSDVFTAGPLEVRWHQNGYRFVDRSDRLNTPLSGHLSVVRDSESWETQWFRHSIPQSELERASISDIVDLDGLHHSMTVSYPGHEWDGFEVFSGEVGGHTVSAAVAGYGYRPTVIPGVVNAPEPATVFLLAAAVLVWCCYRLRV